MSDDRRDRVVRACYNEKEEYWGEFMIKFIGQFFTKKQKTYRPLIIYGLCGPIGVGAHKSGDAYYWTASVILAAWHEEGSEEIHEEKIRLEKECDQEGVLSLQQQLTGNTIFQARVRPSEEGFELLELLQSPCEDALLQTLQPKELKKEEAVDDKSNLFVFGKEEIQVEENSEEAMHLFYKLKKRQAGWRSAAVKQIADTFVPAFNERQEKGKHLTKKEFNEKVVLRSISLSEDGSDTFVFHFAFDKDGTSYEYHVSGSISKGIQDCRWKQNE